MVFCGGWGIIYSWGWFEGVFVSTFSHWQSLVPESCVYFKPKSFERSFRFFKYSRQIVVSSSFSSPILDCNKENHFQRKKIEMILSQP